MKFKIQKVGNAFEILIEKPKENVYEDYYVFSTEKNIKIAKKMIEFLKEASVKR